MIPLPASRGAGGADVRAPAPRPRRPGRNDEADLCCQPAHHSQAQFQGWSDGNHTSAGQGHGDCWIF
eukprot:2000923-Prymnesium_polylepis.3